MALTIGVDVGGTKIAAGVVDESGEILAKTRVPTPADPQWAVDAIAQGVRELKEQFPDVAAVGVGAPGFVNRDRSTVLMAPNIAWENEPLKQRVEELTGLETVVENDANCAAWAEFRFGAAAEYEDMVLITVGTGIGGGIVLDGRLHRGRFGVAGEIGHLNMVPDGLECGCGGHGCWEQYGSGRALRRYGRERAAADPIAGKRMLDLNDGVAETIRGIHITEAAEEGDPLALSCYAELADWLGRGMADLAALFDPAVFVLGGGVSDSGNLLLDPVAASFEKYLTGGPARPRAHVVLASMGSASGIAGAADLARI
ncbi:MULTISPECIES: ROK family glucokinase [Kitasatospora]|uniref:Glucokinase n=1 Tax=Kitasatospora cineracea TaxID=88074 RepID=A0A3N4S966_9ACTN|nr:MULTISPECIES: ROK family glucokinase [Kitasatospora]ROR44833.1 glucokinase [Kitasatospora cineracea]RPE35200.1 glucokinase [Kitasatospora cineracea]WAL71420.1 ROK family glucokinase [Kitasatospora sp. YST-16]WNW37459.1 ROK family glucokinase [Streptomyces sp. Li-HN-5-13]